MFSIHKKLRFFCEVPGCAGNFSRREYYKKHALSHHQNLGTDAMESLLESIKNAQPSQKFWEDCVAAFWSSRLIFKEAAPSSFSISFFEYSCEKFSPRTWHWRTEIEMKGRLAKGKFYLSCVKNLDNKWFYLTSQFLTVVVFPLT